ncbi:hypothetical protein EKD04_013565 [Chloroflexales bacterium ZM16-3]|nr:hypothetical protein [Chloroflexales bacterium ZM16-3]
MFGRQVFLQVWATSSEALLADLAAQRQPAPAPIRLPLRTLVVTARHERWIRPS